MLNISTLPLQNKSVKSSHTTLEGESEAELSNAMHPLNTKSFTRIHSKENSSDEKSVHLLMQTGHGMYHASKSN